MPRCSECVWLDPSVPRCTSRILKARAGAGRQCDMAIEEAIAAEARGAILEIGGGVNQVFRRAVWRKGDGTFWVGIDGNWDDRPFKQRYKGLASAIPFGDESFDWVVAFQSMEHWGQYGDTVESGIADVFRVLKDGGIFAATVPMNSHGGDMFVLGDVEGLRGAFSRGWRVLRMEEWRRDHRPLPPDPPDEKEIAALRRVLPAPEPVTQWVLEVRAKKDRSTTGRT